jgi:hypothetical protein
VSAGGDGGGILMMASFNDDANIARLGAPREQVIIEKGGRLENNGQFWFGADDEHSPDVRVHMTINEGTVDLTGGTIPLTNSTLSVDADWAFFYDYSEFLGRPKNEEYIVNFTGPGSITVDSAGINVYTQDSSSIWSGGTALEYEDLWDLGILQANGLSGKTGSVPNGGNSNVTLTPALFSDYFTTTGTAGSDDYTLISLIAAVNADVNQDGTIDAADRVAMSKFPQLYGEEPDMSDMFDRQFGQATPPAGGWSGNPGVPEPGAMLLMLFGLASISLSKRRSR